MPHLYFYAENLGLNASQRSTLIAQLKALGNNDHPNPSHRNHWRIRMDGNAVIFHLEIDESMLTPIAIRNRLAAIFGIANTSVTYSSSNVTLAIRPSPVVTYRYNSLDRLRFGVFGGLAASWPESQVEVLAYLAANQAAWEVSQ